MGSSRWRPALTLTQASTTPPTSTSQSTAQLSCRCRSNEGHTATFAGWLSSFFFFSLLFSSLLFSTLLSFFLFSGQEQRPSRRGRSKSPRQLPLEQLVTVKTSSSASRRRPCRASFVGLLCFCVSAFILLCSVSFCFARFRLSFLSVLFVLLIFCRLDFAAVHSQPAVADSCSCCLRT